MGRKIMCPECNTVFDEDVLKAKNSENTCLVCGASLGGETDLGSGDKEDIFEMLFFDYINTPQGQPEYNYVNAYCSKCECPIIINLNEVDKFSDDKYVILKNKSRFICEECRQEHYGKKILYKKKSHYTTVNIPHCPICQSTNLRKITVGSKLLAAGTIGVFALPHTSKTYECNSCGYKF